MTQSLANRSHPPIPCYHYLARFRRRTKVVSKCPIMVDPAPRLHHHLRDPKNHAALAAIFLSIVDLDS
ncbi:MAG: hypothetical protein WAM29_09790, partial [Methylocella sp.]